MDSLREIAELYAQGKIMRQKKQDCYSAVHTMVLDGMTFTRYTTGKLLAKDRANNKLLTTITEFTPWGLRVPPIGWAFSARAIFNGDTIEFDYDRATRRDIHVAGQVLVGRALVALEYLTRRHYLAASSDEWVIGRHEDMTLLATTNRSAGYLYISVFENIREEK